MNTEHIKEILRDLNEFKDKIAFKGGTSLFLKHESMKRVSVDIDLMYWGDDENENIVQDISELLTSKGYTVEDAEEGDYGVAINVKREKWEKYVSIDISKYIRGKLFKGITISGISHKEEIEGLYVFQTEYTFFEKLLAGSLVVESWDPKENEANKIRKLRHLEDVATLNKNIEISFLNKYMLLTRQNEINIEKFNSINHWSDLPIFDEEKLSQVKEFYEDDTKYADERKDGGVKLPFEEVLNELANIKSNLTEFKFNTEEENE